MPELRNWVEWEKERDLQGLSTDEWLQLWRERRERVLDDFGAQLMLPSLLASMALDDLRSFAPNISGTRTRINW